MILDNMSCCFWKLELVFWTYGWMRFLGLDTHAFSRPQTPMSKYFFRFYDFIGFISWFWRNMRSCLWKLELGFLTNGLISPLPKALGPNCPKLVLTPQIFQIWPYLNSLIIIKLPFSLQEHVQIFSLPSPSKTCALPFDFALERDPKNIFYYQRDVRIIRTRSSIFYYLIDMNIYILNLPVCNYA